MKRNTLYITRGAVIAAIYLLLTLLTNELGLANGIIQLRLSEALTILPVFTPAATAGLAVGCLLSNLLTGCAAWDVLFGSLATLLGALGTRAWRKRPVLAVIPPILSNTVIIPFVLKFAYGAEGALPYFMLTVGLGELLSCGVLGGFLLATLKKYRLFW